MYLNELRNQIKLLIKVYCLEFVKIRTSNVNNLSCCNVTLFHEPVTRSYTFIGYVGGDRNNDQMGYYRNREANN